MDATGFLSRHYWLQKIEESVLADKPVELATTSMLW